MKTAVPVCLLLLVGCAGGPRPLQKPKLSLAGVRFTGLTLETIRLQVDLALDNPNSFAPTGPEIDFKIDLDGDPLVDGKMPVNGSIRANGRTMINLPLEIHVLEAVEKIVKLKGRDQFPFRVEGGVAVDVGVLGRLRFPFAHSGTLPVPKPVGIRIAGFKREKGGDLLTLRAKMTLEIKNKNIFPLSNLGGKVRLTLDGTDAGEFDATCPEGIPAGGEGAAALVMDLKVPKLIRKLASGSFKAALTGDIGVNTP